MESVHRVLRARARVPNTRHIGRWTASATAALITLLLAGCADAGKVSEPTGVGTLTGVVRSAAESAVLSGATIRVGSHQATSDLNGRFEFTGLTVGASIVSCERPGYATAEAAISIGAGANTHDCTLSVQEIYRFGTNAVLAPAGGGPLVGAIVVLGGPVASGFVTGDLLALGQSPAVEASQQALGASLRVLARQSHVALLGVGTTGMRNASASDAEIFSTLDMAAQASGHAELAVAPVLMFGISGGGPEAAGLVERNPARVIGLLERVPEALSTLTTAAALQVPTFVMLAQYDGLVDEAARKATFEAHRAAGGLWALVVEPGREHYGSSYANNAAVIEWMDAVLALRIPPTAGNPLVALDPAAGWLGNQTTHNIAAWAAYPDDRATSSWLLNASVALSWRALARSEGPIQRLLTR